MYKLPMILLLIMCTIPVRKSIKGRSNDFDYKENINALYVNYNRPFKGVMVQLDLRAENTNAEGTSEGLKWDDDKDEYVPYDSTFKRNYTDFFPDCSGYIQQESDEPVHAHLQPS